MRSNVILKSLSHAVSHIFGQTFPAYLQLSMYMPQTMTLSVGTTLILYFFVSINLKLQVTMIWML